MFPVFKSGEWKKNLAKRPMSFLYPILAKTTKNLDDVGTKRGCKTKQSICCVFGPANRWFACCSLVKITFCIIYSAFLKLWNKKKLFKYFITEFCISFTDLSKDSSIGSALNWYHEGRGFEARQGRELLNLNKKELLIWIQLNCVVSTQLTLWHMVDIWNENINNIIFSIPLNKTSLHPSYEAELSPCERSE